MLINSLTQIKMFQFELSFQMQLIGTTAFLEDHGEVYKSTSFTPMAKFLKKRLKEHRTNSAQGCVS